MSAGGSVWNGVVLLAQGGMQLSFLQRWTGQPLRYGLGFAYLGLLSLGCYLATALGCAGLAVGTEYLALYGLSCWLLADDSGATGGLPQRSGCVLATAAVFGAQWSFGILSPLLTLVGPHLVGSQLLNGLVGGTDIAALGCCYGVFRLLAAPYMPSRPAKHTMSVPGSPLPPVRPMRLTSWPVVLGVVFVGVTERYLLASAYGNPLMTVTTVTAVPSAAPGTQLLLLALQLLGGGTLWALLGGPGVQPRDARQGEPSGDTDAATVAALRQTLQLQATYVTEALCRDHQTRALRHDIRNHLTVLEGLLQRGQLQQARTYLHQLTAVANELSAPVYTGNPVVDVLLQQKTGALVASGVEVTIRLTLPRPCAVDDVSLCILFANALDNACNALQARPAAPTQRVGCTPTQTEGSPTAPAVLEIRSTQQGAFLLLEFVNTCRDPGPVVPGTGLANIRAVAERYGGTLTVGKTGDRFCLRVLFRCS